MKTQEEYALEIDEIVRRDVESRQSDWFKIDKEIFMQPENKNKAFAYVSASPLSSTWYWSSTESSQAVAWYVVFSSGLTGTGNKHIGDMVRAVIDF